MQTSSSMYNRDGHVHLWSVHQVTFTTADAIRLPMFRSWRLLSWYDGIHLANCVSNSDLRFHTIENIFASEWRSLPDVSFHRQYFFFFFFRHERYSMGRIQLIWSWKASSTHLSIEWVRNFTKCRLGYHIFHCACVLWTLPKYENAAPSLWVCPNSVRMVVGLLLLRMSASPSRPGCYKMLTLEHRYRRWSCSSACTRATSEMWVVGLVKNTHSTMRNTVVCNFYKSPHPCIYISWSENSMIHPARTYPGETARIASNGADGALWGAAKGPGCSAYDCRCGTQAVSDEQRHARGGTAR